MKKTISILLGVILLFTLTACSCSKDKPTDSNNISSKIDSDDGAVESTLNIQESFFTYEGTKKLKTESEVIGKPIDFTIGANVTVYTGKYTQSKVATSYSQLTETYDTANGNGYEDKNYISKYNEEFFVDKAVIMLFLETDDGRSDKYPYTIESVTVSGDSVYVNQSEKREYNVKYSTVMRYYRVCIEVNKKDLNNATYLYDTLWQIVDDRSVPYKDYISLGSEKDVIGQKIAYKTVYEQQVSVSKYNPAVYPKIATTSSDLVSILESANITTSVKPINNYNEEFFKNKAVIILFERYGRGANVNPCKMKSVTVDNNTVYVNRSIVDLYDELVDYSGKVNYYLTIIEINKSEIRNAKQLICGFIKE